MYKKIDRNNDVFKTQEFQKDKYKFCIALQNLASDNPIIYSNEKDYFLIRKDNNLPIWIWTKDNIDISLVKEIEQVIKLFLVNETKDKFTCKKEFYDLLINDNFNLLNKEDYFEMGILYCKEVKQPKKCDGYMLKADLSDSNILAEFWFQDNLETGDGLTTIEQSKLDVLKMLEEGNTYILKNKENKIVCMARYQVSNDIARINHVFTPKEERGKAYCANLIYNLSNMLLNNNITPMLYTDYNYIPSNKSYENVGYKKDGILISFSCSKEEF